MKKKDKAVYFLENDSDKYSSCLSQQSSKAKPSTKLVLVSREPLQINPIKKMFMRLIYSVEKFKFSWSQNNC